MARLVFELIKAWARSIQSAGLKFENFLGEIGSGRIRKVSFHSTLKFRAHLKRVGSLLVVLELDGRFEFINDIVRAVSYVRILPGLL